MENFGNAVGHGKLSILGTVVSFTLGFIGKLTLNDLALIGAVLSGFGTFLYTLWKWYQDWRKLPRKHKTPKK